MTGISVIATNGKDPATGYGKMEIGLERSLADMGLLVSNRRKADVGILTGDPGHVDDLRGRPGRLWCFTMSESDQVSPGWVDDLNTHYERVLVPCPPLVQVYVNSGVTIPVSYVPLGVDFSPIAWVDREANPQVFTFLTYSLGDMRKGAHLVMLAFNRQFKDNPRVRLVVKCRDALSWLDGLEDEQISVVTGKQEEAAWLDLMAHSHAFIFPSYGEGFGLPPREAVLSGMPTVATKHLGMWDVDYWGYPLRVGRMLPAQFDEWTANADGSRWAEPNFEDIDRWMIRIYRNYAGALERTRRGRDYLLRNFTWAQTARRIAALAAEAAALDARIPAH